MAGKVSKRGGARPNSGPKKGAKYQKRTFKTASEKTKARWEAAARKLENETGETVEYHALKIIIDKDVQGSVKASVIKAYNEALIIKQTESKTKSESHTFEHKGPSIGLPPMDEDPALKVVSGGKK